MIFALFFNKRSTSFQTQQLQFTLIYIIRYHGVIRSATPFCSATLLQLYVARGRFHFMLRGVVTLFPNRRCNFLSRGVVTARRVCNIILRGVIATTYCVVTTATFWLCDIVVVVWSERISFIKCTEFSNVVQITGAEVAFCTESLQSCLRFHFTNLEKKLELWFTPLARCVVFAIFRLGFEMAMIPVRYGTIQKCTLKKKNALMRFLSTGNKKSEVS